MARKKTRTDGEGTVYEDPPGSGRWRAELWIDGRKTSRIGPGKKAAAAKLADLKKARDLRLKVQDGRQTLTTWFDYWLGTIAPLEGRKAKTIAGYRFVADRYILPTLGQRTLAALTVRDVERWVQQLAAAGGRDGGPLARETVANAMRRLRTALSLAVARKAIPENVAAHVKVPTGPAGAPGAAGGDGEERADRYLSPEQVRQLLAAFADHRLRALYALAATTGPRQGELIGLRWGQLHLDAAEPAMLLREQIQRVKVAKDQPRQIVVDSTKNRKARRVPLSPELVALLRAHKARQAAERLILGDAWRGEDLVFTSTAGTPLDASRLLRQFKTGLTRAGLPDVTFHSLRHSAGSIMLAAGAQIVDVAEILGHSTPLVTARIYAHSFREGQRRAVDSASAILLRSG